MRIFIDIGHPAHVHYFKNFIKIMTRKKHNFIVTARNRKHIFELLSANNINYISRGKGAKNPIGKIFYMVKSDILLYKLAQKFKPDVFLHFGAVYASHVSRMMGKTDIFFDDTESARMNHKFYVPFANVICTPSCFKRDFGKKQMRFKGYMELCYLHPKHFIPNPSIFDLLGINKNEKFVIVRFVAWEAGHDFGHSGLNQEMKRKTVEELSKYIKVFITSEGELPPDLRPYQINIPPHRIHDALSFATLYIGEGATMASECAMLGTPAIYVNTLSAGTLEEQEKYGLIFCYKNQIGVLEKALELLNTPDLKQTWQIRRQKMLSEKIDVTAFMVWLVENYPESIKIMKDNPDYQYNFRSADSRLGIGSAFYGRGVDYTDKT